MGCNFTKNLPEDRKKQDLNNTTDAAPVEDPRMPLTVRQRFSISKSWKAIARAMEQTGVDMFVRLFQQNEELLELFEKFKDLKTREARTESEELQEHGTLVMSSLDESIMSLDNVDYCIDYLHNVGKLHRKVSGFKSEYFWHMETPFLEAVKETLGDRYTDNIETIYKITIHFILENLIKGYDMAAGGENNV